MQKRIAVHLPEVARIDVRHTTRANDAAVLAAIRKHAEIELPLLVLDGLGLSIEAAERRAGKKRPSCWYGDPKAHTSNAGLGVTVDERYQTSIQVAIWGRSALELYDRARKIDEPWSARQHSSFGNWESSVIAPLATMSIGIVEITDGRRGPQVASAWRSAWKDIRAIPQERRATDDAPDGAAFASAFLGFFGRLIPPAEYASAGKQLARLKSPDAHLVTFRIVDLAARGVLPEVLEQAELFDLAKELRTLAPIRAMPALLAARDVVERVAAQTQAISDRAQALCNVVDPTVSEIDSASDSVPTEVNMYLQQLDAAYVLGTPNLDDVTREFFTELVTIGGR